MAIGGALRAALKAGNFAQAAMESRRAARALRELNASGGISAPSRMEFAREGLPTSNSTVSRMLDGGFTPDMYGWHAEGLRGNPVFLNPNTGTRDILPPFSRFSETQNPIQAPYEGFRVWPGGRMNQLPGFGEQINVGAVPGGTVRSLNSGVPFSLNAPPPWFGSGSGPAPSFGRFLDRDMSTGGGRLYNEEMGALQGQRFFAPSVPHPPRSYYGTPPWIENPDFLF